jgi:hypothetical protein
MTCEGCELPRATDPRLVDASDTSSFRDDAAIRVDGGHGDLLRFTHALLVRPGVASRRLSRADGEGVESIETRPGSPSLSMRPADPEPLCESTLEIAALSRRFA